ncbi:hypothetical protein MTO96_028039 [Rhipicephalus appendiculatus]
MKVQLRANEPVGKLAERLSHAGGPSAVTDLDLTNCFHVDTHEALLLIIECKQLRRLLCAASPITPSDVLKLLTVLPHLEEVQFSNLVSRIIVDLELVRLTSTAISQASTAPRLQRVYVEIGREHNFRLLSFLLRCCPKVHYLHVHLVCGEFLEGLRECRVLLEEHRQLDTFKLTSELPSNILREPP